MSQMAERLEQWTSDTLKQYVTLLGGSSAILRKADRIAFITSQLLNDEGLRDLWQKLDSLAQRAVSTAYHQAGVFDAAAFAAQYGTLPPRPQKAGYASWYYKEPILFDLFVLEGEIPADLMPRLAALVLPPDPFRLEGDAEPPQVIERWREVLPVERVETETRGQADILAYLQLVEQGALAWTSAKNQLTKGSVRKVQAQLLDGERDAEDVLESGRALIRPFGLDLFTQGAGLVSTRGKLTEVGRAYLRRQDPALLLAAFERWTEQGPFDELTRVTALKGLNARGTQLTSPASRRAQIIEALSWCPVGRWIGVGDFYRALVIWQFDFAVEKMPSGNLYVGYREYGTLYGSDYWTVVKGLYINAILWEYLGTLGALDLAYADSEFTLLDTDLHDEERFSPHEGLLAFRINSWGAYLLGQADEYVPSQPRRKALFTIDLARRVHLRGELLPGERLRLEQMTTREEGNYQLDAGKLLTAVESGQTLADLVTFLTEHHEGEMPADVRAWLDQLRKNQSLFQAKGTALLVTVKQKALLELVQGDPVLATLCRVLDDTTLVVPSAREQRFRTRLKELGYLL